MTMASTVLWLAGERSHHSMKNVYIGASACLSIRMTRHRLGYRQWPIWRCMIVESR
jgi:hypothetical protein